jgi:hypothetical protein
MKGVKFSELGFDPFMRLNPVPLSRTAWVTVAEGEALVPAAGAEEGEGFA